VGFSTPLVDWLGKTIPSAFLDAYMNSAIRRVGVFRDERLEELCRIQQSGEANILWLLFSLYLFVRWSEEWLFA